MENLFVPFELAKKLKEKGFNESCFGYYWSKYDYAPKKFKVQLQDCCLGEEKDSSTIRRHIIDIVAPLYQQAVDWFREKHNIDIVISPIIFGNKKYHSYIYKNGVEWSKSMSDTYYEGLNKAIEEALNLI